MAVEITKDKSKIEAEVIKAIKSGFSVLTKQNNWMRMTGWQKPGDGWYNQIEDGAMIEIKVEFHKSPDGKQLAYLVWFEGVPKVRAATALRSRVGSLPYKMPAGT